MFISVWQKKKERLILFLLFCLLGCSNTIEGSEKVYAKPRLAVMTLETKNVDEATVQSVTELAQSLLENSGLYIMTERNQVEKVLKEQALQLSGTVDEGTAIQIGKMLGASKLMLGSINKMDERYLLNGRIVDIETGQIEISASRNSRSAMGLNDATLSLVKILTKKDRSEAQRALSITLPREGTFAVYVVGYTSYLTVPDGSQSVSSGNESFTASVHEAGLQQGSLGIGVKYFRWKSVYFDFAFVPVNASKSLDFKVRYSDGSTSRTTYSTNISFPESTEMIGSINTIIKAGVRDHFVLGAGVARLEYKLALNRGFASYPGEGVLRSFDGTISMNSGSGLFGNNSLFYYFITAGYERIFNNRFGISLLADLGSGNISSSDMYIMLERYFQNGSHSYDAVSILQPKFNPLIVRLAASLYFD